MNNKYKRILTVQDISCVGQCSLTVALPILSACGVETAVLPSAVLSTHTAGFKGYTFRDLTSDMEPIRAHWEKEEIKFSGMYTGYLGSKAQIDACLDIAKTTLEDSGLLVVDPAMADNGKLYPGFDLEFVDNMKRLVAKSDICVPNLTEITFLTGDEYKTSYDKAYIRKVCENLINIGTKVVVLTGVSFREGYTGAFVLSKQNDGSIDEYYYEHEFLPNSCHGTGDVYASAFMGALMQGKNPCEAAKIACDYTVICIKNTAGDKSHWYGVKFEPVLGKLIEML